MSSIISDLQERPRGGTGDPRVLTVGTEETDGVLDALSSDTARAALAALHEEPATPSELARRIDTTVQNLHYHLSNLADAGLVEAAGTVYSEKGNEMTVYAPACDPLVLAGSDESTTDLRDLLGPVLAAVSLLAGLGLAVQVAVERLTPAPTRSADVVGAAGTGTSPPATTAPLVEPGLLFFLGGLVVLAVAVAVLASR